MPGDDKEGWNSQIRQYAKIRSKPRGIFFLLYHLLPRSCFTGLPSADIENPSRSVETKESVGSEKEEDCPNYEPAQGHYCSVVVEAPCRTFPGYSEINGIEWEESANAFDEKAPPARAMILCLLVLGARRKKAREYSEHGP